MKNTLASKLFPPKNAMILCFAVKKIEPLINRMIHSCFSLFKIMNYELKCIQSKFNHFSFTLISDLSSESSSLTVTLRPW